MVTMSWKVEVDGGTCIGSGMCAALLPEVFELEGATATVVEGEVKPDESVLDAADSCPAMAIEVTERGEVIGPRP
ncbi:cytochrome [Amycolatopsis coloradensis]|uniref:Ferredoxin n=2 Tax=Amycolatopsis coloradensis TaxID=76021 RepID=A0A1R0KJZ9_9PSEU|nr:cytochrome [Amycolatopsis coloradensis]